MTPNQEARFWERLVADPGTGCWLWGGSGNGKGYGKLMLDGEFVYAHRALYEHERGKIPVGLTLDHLCRNRACVRPDHLEPVTQRENLRRGYGATGNKARQTRCIHGHLFTPENTRIKLNGTRACRACDLQRSRPSGTQGVR